MDLFGLFVIGLIFVIGACIGSFLNVVILRTLSGESIVLPPSKCPKCQAQLQWWHNIPVISYVCLKGKCASCSEPISIQYPIIEFITGMLFVILFLKFGITIDTLFACFFASLLIVIAGTDMKEKVVFDVHTYSLIIGGLVYALLVTAVGIYMQFADVGSISFSKELVLSSPVVMSLLGLILGVLIMEGLARLGYLIAGTRAFGEGDTFIAAGLGAMFGWRALLFVLVLSIIIQLILTLPVFFKKLIEQKEIRTAVSLGIFIFYAVAFLFFDHYEMLTNKWLYGCSVFLLTGLGIYCCKQILAGIRNKETEMTYLPFGPAMVIAALLVMIL